MGPLETGARTDEDQDKQKSSCLSHLRKKELDEAELSKSSRRAQGKRRYGMHGVLTAVQGAVSMTLPFSFACPGHALSPDPAVKHDKTSHMQLSLRIEMLVTRKLHSNWANCHRHCTITMA